MTTKGGVRCNICHPCAAKLRAVLQAEGEQAMARRMHTLLCSACLANARRTAGVPDGPMQFELARRS
jgi:hypothetical protein